MANRKVKSNSNIKKVNDTAKYLLENNKELSNVSVNAICKCKCSGCLMGGHCYTTYCIEKPKEVIEQESIERSVFDKYFRDIKHPPRKILKKYFGMVITGVEREREQNASGDYTERLAIELDGFVVLEIVAKNGQVVIQTKPTGIKRFSLTDKVKYVIENEVRE